MSDGQMTKAAEDRRRLEEAQLAQQLRIRQHRDAEYRRRLALGMPPAEAQDIGAHLLQQQWEGHWNPMPDYVSATATPQNHPDSTPTASPPDGLTSPPFNPHAPQTPPPLPLPPETPPNFTPDAVAEARAAARPVAEGEHPLAHQMHGSAAAADDAGPFDGAMPERTTLALLQQQRRGQNFENKKRSRKKRSRKKRSRKKRSRKKRSRKKRSRKKRSRKKRSRKKRSHKKRSRKKRSRTKRRRRKSVSAKLPAYLVCRSRRRSTKRLCEQSPKCRWNGKSIYNKCDMKMDD